MDQTLPASDYWVLSYFFWEEFVPPLDGSRPRPDRCRRNLKEDEKTVSFILIFKDLKRNMVL